MPLRIRTPAISSLAPSPTSSVFWIKVAGVWKQAIVWIKVAGVWKPATPKIRNIGTWK